MDPDQPDQTAGFKDGRTWRIGNPAEVAWIADNTSPSLEITSAIPAIFESYATVVIPEGGTLEGDQDRDAQNAVLVELLGAQSPDQPWILGYIKKGQSSDVVFPSAPQVLLYARWPYVLVEAGPEQAATWRDDSGISTALPELIFPSDRSWLISTLWDDDWRCIGGSADFIAAVLREPSLRSYEVNIGQDATPPGHIAR
jgi:hypothetical protein